MHERVKEEPVFTETLLNSLHVDDVNTGANSVEENYKFYLKVKQNLQRVVLINESFVRIPVN